MNTQEKQGKDTPRGIIIEGLKIGLEIHQQAGRPQDKKLFCNCPATIIERQPDIVVQRQLRAAAGEIGVIDAAAAAEQAKGKIYTYHLFNDATCLVEIDEEPPHPVNQEVITTAVMVAKACKSIILPTVQFMRKTIADGSATAGFQRTGLLALGGTVPEITPLVRVQTICVEEDAAKIISRMANEDTYNLSRLGIPLIEIATEPDITTSEQARAVAAQLGMILRSTKRVKRGLGTIRQDLNVSIPDGTRVEIKGCQDLRMIPTIINYEAQRQQELLVVKKMLSERNVNNNIHSSSDLAVHYVDVTKIFQKSSAGFIKNALAKGDRAIGIKVTGFATILGKELCPNYRVGSELADLARARGFGGLIHSDEDMKKYGVEKKELEHAFNTNEIQHDAFVILIGKQSTIEPLFKSIILPRLEQFALGVPKEVRKANPDGTTSFLRLMPGSARMYPETDIPLVTITPETILAPKLFTEQVKEIIATTKIHEEQAKELVREGIPFTEYIERYPSIEPSFIAAALLTYGKEILARYKKEIDHIALLDTLFDAAQNKKIPKSAIFEILVQIAQGKTTIHTIAYDAYTQLSDEELQHIIHDAITAQPLASSKVLMGIVMAKARGKADGKKIMEIVEKEKQAQL